MEKQLKEIPVLFENDFCLVFNKDSGLSVQGGEGVRVSLDSILSEKYSPRPLLVHRLDKDTSGVILVAKTGEAAAFFSSLFSGGPQRDRRVIKQYLGICSGVPEQAEGVIKMDLEFRVKGNGKDVITKKSETRYKLLSTGKAGEVSVSALELELTTGRMHQIRRHLAKTGHPLLGDDKYGDFVLNKKLRKTMGLKHLLLHASRLIIPPSSPMIPEGLDITAPLPKYFFDFFSVIR